MVGETVGQYRLISELGRGRFGITYRGEHLTNGTFAVIKQLSLELTQDEQFSRRFIHESENLIRLFHSQLATILGLILQSGKYFIISEEAVGSDLAEYLKRKEKLSATESCEIITAVCTALDYLHKRNYSHSHLHPGNIIISKEGTVKLTDFYIASLVGELGFAKIIHQPDLLYSEYLAPELKRSASATPAIDVYALGVLLYELITGTQFEPRKSHPLIPASLQKIIAKATAELPADRYASVTDITADLTVFLEFGGEHHPVQKEVAFIREPKRIHPAWWAIWVFVLAVLLAFPLYYLFRPRGVAEPPTVSMSREIPFKREAMPISKPLEEIIAIETTGIEKKPKKKEVVREESMVTFEPSQPVLPTRKQPKVGEVFEETEYTAKSKDSSSEKSAPREKGGLLNIPKEDTSMMEKTVMPVPSVMVVVPAGEFIMGSSSGNINEQPEHRVYLDTFLIDAYEVSNQQYKAFIDATGFQTPSGWKNKMYPTGQANYPVTNISWSEASAYAAWIGCRLPTEAEWEKAARGSDGRIYPWGNQFLDNVCNYAGSNYKASVPVGIYPKGRSPFGCYDMAGNVAEWTADFYQFYAGNTANPGYYLGDFRVIRGGAFDSPKEFLRTSARLQMDAASKSPTVGFRTVKSLGGVPAIASGRLIEPFTRLYLKNTRY